MLCAHLQNYALECEMDEQFDEYIYERYLYVCAIHFYLYVNIAFGIVNRMLNYYHTLLFEFNDSFGLEKRKLV